ncbi:MAG: NADH-quinone oxidoreductase subunit H [Rhodospirillales bacterium]|jgi:formate hydrogenlyase subunit 4|nr:NADH-quinone oxidoreductase subunit H [Rhodospirillales bacterium]
MILTSVLWQVLQTLIAVLAAPLVTGFVRLIKARLNGRIGPSPLQPYRDLARLLRKELVLAGNASWLFRIAPYFIFSFTWMAASLVPSFTTNLVLIPTADMITLVALLGAARFMIALAGLDIGTSFGGLGASREMLIASLAEPAMLMTVFTLALLAGTTAPARIIDYVLAGGVGLQVSMGLSLVALLLVAIAENGRIPIDNPATHLELTMVHEAMVLEYTGRHLALIEAASMVRLQLYISLIICIFLPWGISQSGKGLEGIVLGLFAYGGKLALLAAGLAVFETVIAKMRVFRYADFLGGALLLSLLATLVLYVSEAV